MKNRLAQSKNADTAAHGIRGIPLFCPKCKYTCVIRFKDGRIKEIKMPDA